LGKKGKYFCPHPNIRKTQEKRTLAIEGGKTHKSILANNPLFKSEEKESLEIEKKTARSFIFEKGPGNFPYTAQFRDRARRDGGKKKVKFNLDQKETERD